MQEPAPRVESAGPRAGPTVTTARAEIAPEWADRARGHAGFPPYNSYTIVIFVTANMRIAIAHVQRCCHSWNKPWPKNTYSLPRSGPTRSLNIRENYKLGSFLKKTTRIRVTVWVESKWLYMKTAFVRWENGQELACWEPSLCWRMNLSQTLFSWVGNNPSLLIHLRCEIRSKCYQSSCVFLCCSDETRSEWCRQFLFTVE